MADETSKSDPDQSGLGGRKYQAFTMADETVEIAGISKFLGSRKYQAFTMADETIARLAALDTLSESQIPSLYDG